MNTKDILVKDGHWLYCQKHKDWFYSEKYAKTKKFPARCPTCKNMNWWQEKVRKRG